MNGTDGDWGRVYRRLLKKGMDHGSAAYEADEAMRQREVRQRRLMRGQCPHCGSQLVPTMEGES